MDNVTALVVVYKTLDYITVAYESFRKFYPTLPLVIVDNSEGDPCSEYVDNLQINDPQLTVFHMKQNVGHGVGLDYGIRSITTEHIYFFDSDTKMLKGGVIEELLTVGGDNYYTVSTSTYVDRGGRLLPRAFRGERIKFVYGYATLLNRKKYLKYPPLTKYGLPILEAYIAIHDEGNGEKLLKTFPVNKYVYHASGGTRARYGDCEKIVEKDIEPIRL
jgi:glycosyltransferase involved in cell wall biosynthesis